MSALVLLIWSLTLRPIATLDAFLLRWEIAAGIVSATDDPMYQRLAMSIAHEESQFRRDVADCRVYGDGGRSAGPFQTSFVNDGQRWAICHSTEAAAVVALQRMRESEAMCSHLEPTSRHSAYASGRCGGVGAEISKRRWALAVRWVQ